MREQTDRAIAEAAACLFLIDARAGVTPLDETFASMLRASGKPVVLVANKAEGAAGEAGALEAFSLGLGEPISLSAEHGQGMGELYAALAPILEADDPDAEADAAGDDEEAGWDDPLKPLRVAIVGRPNAGKSTLVNRLLGEERLLTGPEAGLTRDAVSVTWTWRGEDRDWPIKLFDTAGLRRKAKVQSKLEKLSVADALRALQFAEVVVLLIDAERPFDKQDLQIADLILREGRALVIAVNKWDLVADKDAAARDIREAAQRLLSQAPGAPIVFLSAQTGRNVDRLMPAVTRVYVDWNARVKTHDLNEWLRTATDRHPPPAVSGRRIRLRYIAQTKTRPPTFVVQATRAADLPDSYRRYLVNGIREAFDIPAVPIRLILKQPKNPFVSDG